jgi:hypothetical protein
MAICTRCHSSLNFLENIQLLSGQCNRKKGNRRIWVGARAARRGGEGPCGRPGAGPGGTGVASWQGRVTTH